MQPTPLFRPAATQFTQDRFYWGQVAWVQPPGVRRLVWLLTASVLAMLFFLLQVPYARKETVPGYLAPASGTARIHASQTGVVAVVHAKEGDEVDAGQALFSIDTAQIAANGRDVNAMVLNALQEQGNRLSQQIAAETQRAHIDRLRLESLITGTRSEIHHLALQIASQEERIQIAERQLTNGEMLKAQGFVSGADTDRRRAELLEQKQSLAGLLQQQTVRHSQLSEQQFALEQLPATSTERLRVLQGEASVLEQRSAEISGRGAYVILSPIRGRVSGVQATVGQMAEPRLLLATVVPGHSRLQAELFVPTRSIGFIRPGQDVKLLYDAFPYQNFGTYGGKVLQVSRTVLTASDAAGPISLKEPAYRVTVALNRPDVDADGERVALQTDMLLRADIVLDRRPLMDWILKPFKSAGQRVSHS